MLITSTRQRLAKSMDLSTLCRLPGERVVTSTEADSPVFRDPGASTFLLLLILYIQTLLYSDIFYLVPRRGWV